jgi:hypothetical protein
LLAALCEATLAACASGATAPLVPSPAPSPAARPPEMIVGYTADGVIEFGPGANGNVKPIRRFHPFAQAFVYGEDASGNFWSFLDRFTVYAKYIGTLEAFRWHNGSVTAFATDYAQNVYVAEQPAGTSDKHPRLIEIDEFPANAYGKVLPMRRILLGPQRGVVQKLAIDGAGNVYATQDVRGSQIVEYSADASGKAKPVRLLDLPPGYDFFADVKADAAGNLYALAQDPPKPSAIFEYAPAGRSYRTIFRTGIVFPFTVNAAGDLFAVVQFRHPKGDCVEQIVELAHGTSRRLLRIRGNRTVICTNRALSIAVPPS